MLLTCCRNAGYLVDIASPSKQGRTPIHSRSEKVVYKILREECAYSSSTTRTGQPYDSSLLNNLITHLRILTHLKQIHIRIHENRADKSAWYNSQPGVSGCVLTSRRSFTMCSYDLSIKLCRNSFDGPQGRTWRCPNETSEPPTRSEVRCCDELKPDGSCA